MEPGGSRVPKVCAHLNEKELFYVVVGAWAMGAHNIREDVPQGTIEVLLNATPDDRRKLQRHLLYEGMKLTAEDHRHQRYRDPGGETFVFALTQTDYDLLTIGRRKVSWNDYTTIFVASVEDLIIRCLLVRNKAEIAHAAALYRSWRNHIDLGYLVLFARKLGVYRTFLRVKKKEDRL